jgi:hypothetical protein
MAKRSAYMSGRLMSLLVLLFIGILIVALLSRRLVAYNRAMIPSQVMTPIVWDRPTQFPAAVGGLVESIFIEPVRHQVSEAEAAPTSVAVPDENIVRPRSPISPIPPKEPLAPIPPMRR